MAEEAKVNPRDFDVVDFTNKTDFLFTPEMGCMYDGRPISGISGQLGIAPGETKTLPYHLGHRLAENLAKMVQIKRAPLVDEANNPVGKPLWSPEALETLKQSFLTNKYTEEKPIAQTETERLFAKMQEFEKMVADMKSGNTPVQSTQPTDSNPATIQSTQGFADKQEVIAELEKRNITHDKRQSKANLEKLLV